MAIYVHYYETVDEFESAYTSDEYIEPFLGYIEETKGVVFDKPHMTGISIDYLKFIEDVPAEGGVANKDNCSYKVMALWDNCREEDVTSGAVVSGFIEVASSMTEERHSAGTLTLEALYDGFSTSASVEVYQAAFIPTLTGITLDNLEWSIDVPASGGTASKDNCTYGVTAYYDNGVTCAVTEYAVVTGTVEIEASEIEERHSAGTLTLTAEYNGLTDSEDVTVYQEACYRNYFRFNILSGGNIAFGAVPWGNGTATTLTIEYKKNDGEWTNLTSTVFDWDISPETREDVVNSFSSKFSVDAGDVVMFRGNNQAYAFLVSGEDYIDNFNAFFSTARFNVEGNIMSLIDKNNYDTLSALTAPATFSYLFSGCYRLISAENLLLPATTLASNCYEGMFYDFIGDCDWGFDYDMGLTTAPELPAMTLASYCYGYMFWGCTSLTTAPALPATTLAEGCYYNMFYGCTSLTTAPALPATTLAGDCYLSMFYNCTSLTTAPSLPATTLADNCYYNMFYGCTSLTTAPELPATTLAGSCYLSMFEGCTSLTTAPSLPATTLTNYCYQGMFWGCTSLATAPSLPATTLADYCYNGMFSNCTSLTTAPELPATTLAQNCYYQMFYGCTNLNYIKCLATDISASNCTYEWVSNVASSGTFVKDASMTGWTTGVNGIPINWTVEDAS